jgi:hypothetical protein
MSRPTSSGHLANDPIEVDHEPEHALAGGTKQRQGSFVGQKHDIVAVDQ